MTRILIVDDDDNVLTAAVAAIEHTRPEWKIEALNDPLLVGQKLYEMNFDAVISDYDMPGMPGNRLLTEVALAEPLMVRFMISSKMELAREVESLGIAHRFFAKPCDYKAVILELERSLALRKRLRSSRLRTLINSLPALPSPPRTYFTLQRLLADDDFHIRALLDLLKRDMSLTAFLLKAANSSYYGARREVTSLEQAVSLLGLGTVKSVVLGAELFAQLDARKAKAFSVDSLFEHSVRVAGLASSMSERRAETRALKDLAYTAGLLHDIGKLVFIHALAAKYKGVVERAGHDHQALYHEEIAVFGVSHQEVGAYLLNLWGIPEAVVEAVAYHHQPLLCEARSVSVLTFVAAANLFDHGLPSAEPADETSEVHEYLDGLGLNSKDLLM